uniref:RecF/RecN/SMC N-terminal domain-containing protein n=1 Tax=Candidatus Methanophagaceae archaeon ANME-1 ERB6 TaxID=2759912 RepID=A0A7G9YTQ3_9EURY|nr:hypothetical protein KMJFBAND_00024 [Methanosarcinales archaeon ANME-1 ERB6]
MSWVITQLSVRGVKGILDRAGDFDLAGGKSIAIYAPNAYGKSGYADAVEYLFSQEGVVEHLGKGGADSERGGKHAIPHVLAAERDITPEVSVELYNPDSKVTMSSIREVRTGRVDAIPSELEPIIRVAPAHRILRQHDLRRFVVDMEPRKKYSELSRWLGLEHLEQVLTHLTTTEQTLQRTNPDREIDERVQDITKHTNEAVTRYDQLATLQWCTVEAKRHLGRGISIDSLDDVDLCLQSLRERRDEIVILQGKVSEAFEAKRAIEEITSELPSENGQLRICETALAKAVAAEEQVEYIRAMAKNSIFQKVWNSAKDILETQTTDECPICLTPWEKTTVSSQHDALQHITIGLKSLANLTKAQSKQKKTYDQLTTATKDLITRLRDVETAAKKLSLEGIADDVSNLAEEIKNLLETGYLPSQLQEDYKTLLQQCHRLFVDKLPIVLHGVKIEGIPKPAKEIEETIEHMQMLKITLIRLTELQRESEEYRKVERSFSAVANVIQESAATLVDEVIGALQKDVIAIYQKIHPKSVIPNIYIEPDTESKTLIVRVDFHSPDRRVPPAGYLSESQINTLGLALFISSVRFFNQDFPFIFLDDIVSSYDADHRGRIVDVIAEDLQDFQVFLTTHDERFYSMLKSRLSGKRWQFERITSWTFDQGPKREVDALRFDQIEGLIKEGNAQIAGYAVRYYMEEWLDKMCAKYYAYTLHKRGPKEFDRTLFDLWGPFINRLKKIRGDFFEKHVKTQSCFQRLSAHSLLNY